MSYQALSISDSTLLGEGTHRQAQALLRSAWYEGDLLTTILYYLLLILLFALFWWQYKLSPPLAWSVIGVIVYGVGYVVDSITTWQCFRLASEFEKRGILFPYYERNPFMKDKPGLMDQLLNVSTLYSLGVGVAAWLVPGTGIAAGLAHGGAACSNDRKLRRLRVQLRLLDLQTGANKWGKGQKHTESQE